mgnify:CR=1 FL=1
MKSKDDDLGTKCIACGLPFRVQESMKTKETAAQRTLNSVR